MNSKQTRRSTRASNLRASFTDISLASGSNINERLEFPLPVRVEKEIEAGLTREECNEKIAYAKERSDFYLREFNRPDAIQVERDWFQKQCEWYVNRILIYETVLERLSGRKTGSDTENGQDIAS
jgi:hypothetical protein